MRAVAGVVVRLGEVGVVVGIGARMRIVLRAVVREVREVRIVAVEVGVRVVK